jgi:hypothetical protein
LRRANLETLPTSVSKPRYDATQLTPAVVHLGVGAFHRAHQAVRGSGRLGSVASGAVESVFYQLVVTVMLVMQDIPRRTIYVSCQGRR